MELTSSDILLRLLAVFVLITINAFFVTAEFSIVSVRRSRIQHLAESGDYPAQFVRDLHQHIERLLSTTQLGITLSSLALGWIGQDAIAKPLIVGFNQWLPHPFGPALGRTLAIPMAFILIAYLQLVLGELCPKSVALIYSEELSRLLAPPSVVIARFFKPFVWGLNASTRWFLGSVGIRPKPTDAYQLTPEELQLIINTSAESSGLRAEERERLANLFEFGDAIAEEVMVPRTQIVALEQTATVQSFLQELSESRHSRYPIIGESLDDIKGILDFKEIAQVLITLDTTAQTSMQPWMMPPHFIPEQMALGDVLEVMKKTGQPMLIVVDEFGGTAGLITFQDLMSEILGDRYDSDEPDEEEWQQVDEHTFIIQAQMPLDDVNDVIQGELPITDDYHTLAGFMIHHLQTIPAPGAILHYDDWELTLIEAEEHRLHKIQVRRLPPTIEVPATSPPLSKALIRSDADQFPPPSAPPSDHYPLPPSQDSPPEDDMESADLSTAFSAAFPPTLVPPQESNSPKSLSS
ncbi:MAG: hemolysin family protein [Leptolyngbyaceae bacterium]|nr:hemolysin family protein [Leptolyngbyaceae bacterium]